MGRLKLAASPASRCFWVALFISGFTNRYFGDLRSKTDPQYAANADVENQPPKSAIVFVHAGWDHVVALSTPHGLFESVNPLRSPPPLLRVAPRVKERVRTVDTRANKLSVPRDQDTPGSMLREGHAHLHTSTLFLPSLGLDFPGRIHGEHSPFIQCDPYNYAHLMTFTCRKQADLPGFARKHYR
jgi:hypothetical protein